MPHCTTTDTLPITASGQREVLTVATHRKPTPTVTHAIGVTGQHEVLMFGQCTQDPAQVVSMSISLYWLTIYQG